jgi:hypothetical protein
MRVTQTRSVNKWRPSHSSMIRFGSSGVSSKTEWPLPGTTISSEARSLHFRARTDRTVAITPQQQRWNPLHAVERRF